MPGSTEDYGGHVIERVIGRGGSATVYLARGDSLRPVALKVLHPEHRDDDGVARLHREFEFARRVRHRHVVEVHQLGPFWLTMQFIDGGDIGSLPTREHQVQALHQIAAALDHAHRLGVVHCDVAPDNILVHSAFHDGGAVLTDFGEAHSLAEEMAARLARGRHWISLDPARRPRAPEREPEIRATLPYAPPEILLGQMPSAAGDQYGLAATAVAVLSAAPPFNGATPGHLVDAILDQPPPAISVRGHAIPRAVDPVISRALAKDPAQRFESCAQFVAALQAALGAPGD